MQEGQTVIETREGWMIQCRCPCGWHKFPKERLSNGAAWTFNGDMVKPTFTPSMNVHINPPGQHHNSECDTWRCHFIVTDGCVYRCGDCTHAPATSHPLTPWPADKVAYYESLRAAGWP